MALNKQNKFIENRIIKKSGNLFSNHLFWSTETRGNIMRLLIGAKMLGQQLNVILLKNKLNLSLYLKINL